MQRQVKTASGPKGKTVKPKRSKDRASNQRNRKGRTEPTANDLMLEAWKKLYETRRERLI